MEDNIVYDKIDSKKFEEYLCYNTTKNQAEEISSNPVYNLISSFDELNLLRKEKDFFKFIYFNKEKIHSILYNEEKLIEIPVKDDFDLISHVYLNLLIEYEPIIYYKCPFKLIENLYYLQTKEEKSNNFRAIILAKIIWR